MAQDAVKALTYEGKAKIVTVRDERTVEVFFKDDATAFNAQKHQVFAGKGALNSAIAEIFFVYLRGVGLATHFLSRIDERTLLCQRATMVPLEVVVRFFTAGSLCKRTGMPPGRPCEPPIVEFYYKRDDLGDPIVNDDHMRFLRLATPEEVQTLSVQGLKAAMAVRTLCERADLHLIDIKFEFGKVGTDLVLADEISPDSCRLHDRTSGQMMDKDLFRFDKGDLLQGYREVLRRLRAAVLEDPHV